MSSKRLRAYLFIYMVCALSALAATPYAAPDTAQLSAMGLRGAELAEKDSAVWIVKLAGKDAGTLISTERFGRSIKGYAGEVPLLLYIKADGRVGSIYPLPNYEDTRFFERAATILHQWDNLPAADALSKKVDAVSGATYSSTAIIAGVQAALRYYVEGPDDEASAPWLWITFCGGLVIGVVCVALYAKRKRSK